MKVAQLKWSVNSGWNTLSDNLTDQNADLIFIFGGTDSLKNFTPMEEIKSKFKGAKFVGCSTSGEICGTTVSDDNITATVVKFEKAKVVVKSIKVDNSENSSEAGKKLVREFDGTGLRHLFVISEGLNINGSELVSGLREFLPEGVNATGGLAGDGARFKETLIFDESGNLDSNIVTGIAFYGDGLKIGYGSMGGWDSFGTERLVTKSNRNVLFELDNKPALELYKSFLGEKAAELPSSGLLFPLSLRTSENEKPVVRTILGIDEENQSLTFAGDVPEGSYVRLMKANMDRLIDGASNAAQTSFEPLDGTSPELAILISCVGRKLVLKQLVEEEVEAVENIFGCDTALTGFYSYGEISPFSKDAKCELHNQTMTITTFSE